jgi:segregation and condensation protein B
MTEQDDNQLAAGGKALSELASSTGESKGSQPAADDERLGAEGHEPAADHDARADGASPADPVTVVRTGIVSDELKAIIEALVYASPDPLTPKALFKVLESEPREDVQAAFDALRRDYAAGRGGLQLVEVAGGYQIVTRAELSEWVRRLFHERKSQKLSVAALETLAVIAYKQPITAPEITEIRGVNTAGVVATLLERRLVKIAGRKQVVGRPFLYATTREFLIRFGLRDLNDLPRMEDMADVLGFEPPSGLADAGPSEILLPLDAGPDPDKTLDIDEPT